MKIESFSLLPSAIACDRTPELLEFESLSRFLVNLQRSSSWWLGDMLVIGEQIYGDSIYQSIDDTASLRLLERCAKVCREFPPSRRNATLSFTHHQLLSGVSPRLQDALLARAEVEGWDTDQMRQKVREIKGA